MYETYERKEIPAKSRVVLTKEMFDDFFSRIFKGNVPELTATKGLTYDLVYNLVHGRIRSLSVGDYRAIFGVDPPRHAQKRVDARCFRRIWISWLRRVEEIRAKRHEHECRSAAQDQKGTRKKARVSGSPRYITPKAEAITRQDRSLLSAAWFSIRHEESPHLKMSMVQRLFQPFPGPASSTDTYSPFGAFIVVYFSLSCGITAAIKVAPVKRVVSHALAVSHEERALDSLAAFAAIGARVAILPGRIDLDQGKVRLARRRSGERHIGSKCSLEVAKGQHISIPDQTRAHV